MFLLFIVFRVLVMAIMVATLAVVGLWPRRAGRTWIIAALMMFLLLEIYDLAMGLVFQIARRNWVFELYMQWRGYIEYGMMLFRIVGSVLLLIGLLLVRNELLLLQNPSVSSQIRSGPIPHRGELLLTLGILGLIFWPIALVVRYVARKDLIQIRNSQMDPSGKPLTRTAALLGSIGSILFVAISLTLLMIFLCLVFRII